jgi:hypothetical protein
MARSTDAEKVKDPTAQEAADALPVPESGAQEFVQGAITRAAGLIAAKQAIQADLQKSRDFLGFAVTQDDVSSDQAAWVAKYLPKRQHGASGDSTEQEA